MGMMVNGACPLSLLNMYSIQLVALQARASLPHKSPKAFSLLEGASTSRQALYIAKRNPREKMETLCWLELTTQIKLKASVLAHRSQQVRNRALQDREGRKLKARKVTASNCSPNSFEESHPHYTEKDAHSGSSVWGGHKAGGLRT